MSLNSVERGTARGRPRRGLAVLALALALGLAACGGGTTSSSATGGKPVLRIGLTAAGSLNPAVNNDQTLDSLAYEPLTTVKEDGSIGPGLATSWRYVDDQNTVFELTLRENAKFSDGTPVTAAAVKKWMDYFAKAGGPFAPSLPLQSVSAVDDRTVRLTLSKSNPVVPWVLSSGSLWGAIASSKAVDDPKSLDAATAGAGPYTLVPGETVVNDHYVYVPNQFYYDQSAIKFGRVEVKIIPTANSMLQAMQAGQINVAQGDPSTAAAAQRAGFTVSKEPSKNAVSLFMNLAEGPLANLQVRQALNYAIDRKAITTGLFGEFAQPTSAFVTQDGFDADKYQNYYPYDPDRAKQMLVAAGYANGFALTLVAGTADGNAGVPMAQAVAKYLQAVGVDVKITTSSTASAQMKMVFSGEYDSAQLSSGTAPTWYMYAALFGQNGAYNLAHHVDPDMDKLATQAATAKEPAQYWPQIMGISVTQAYMLPVAALDTVWYAKGVSGVRAPVVLQGKPLVSWWSPQS